jgi:crotonobetainyl-CoA:carnitine CoA-transferase CaiB-like acyl-CoA transferase
MSDRDDERCATAERLLGDAWAILTAGDEIARPPVEVGGTWGHLPSRLNTEETAEACVALALAAAAAMPGTPNVGPLRLDRAHIAASVRSERYFRTGGRSAGMGFAPLSRFWETNDGWVRTHANYPWHRRALLAALDLGDDADADVVGAAIAARRAEEVEAAVFAAGGIAGAARTPAAWAAHEQAQAVEAAPLIDHRLVDGAPPRHGRPGDLPASDVRVLDLTRVIAGPVSTRYLSALGADVVRIDPPAYPDMAVGQPNDTLLGKRSAIVDVATTENQAHLEELLARADVVVRGYRPGALDRLGLGEDDLAARHPGLVIVSLAAWGHAGPWAHRRGFDSIVQSVTGIADLESSAGLATGEPGVLPCQLLDHGTGYLAAAAALDGLRRQRATGGTHVRRVSLARTAAWLTGQGRRDRADAGVSDDADQWTVELASADGTVAAIAPPGRIGHTTLTWPEPAIGYGDAAPEFASP